MSNEDIVSPVVLTHGQIVGSDQAIHVDEPDWLDEGYEGPDYPDDIFGAQNNEVPI